MLWKCHRVALCRMSCVFTHTAVGQLLFLRLIARGKWCNPICIPDRCNERIVLITLITRALGLTCDAGIKPESERSFVFEVVSLSFLFTSIHILFHACLVCFVFLSFLHLTPWLSLQVCATAAPAAGVPVAPRPGRAAQRDHIQ